MAFQTVDATKRMRGRSASSQTPSVSYYGKTSQFRLNAAAVNALGNPERLEVLHDPDTNRVALVPDNGENTARCVVLRADSKTAGSRYFGFRSLANLLNIPQDSRATSELTQDAESGYMVATFVVAGETTEETPEEVPADEAAAETGSRRSR